MSWYREDDKMHKNPKWVRITALCDERFPKHPDKARCLAKDAKLLQNVAGNWGAGNNCDGLITRAAIHQIAAEASLTFQECLDAGDVLVKAGFWIVLSKKRGGPGWEINDWLEYQPSKKSVERKATVEKLRKDLGNTATGKRIAAAVRRRDGDHCRYCDEEVNWADRRSPRAGTYDHVDPSLLVNTVENVVVACNYCNKVKGERTPEEANMPLTRPRGLYATDLAVSSHGLTAFGPQTNRGEGSGRAGTGQVRSGRVGSERVGWSAPVEPDITRSPAALQSF